jgi:hypothetical protein
MPLYMLGHAAFEGLATVPFLVPTVKALPILAVIYLLKVFFSGATNKSESKMHSKVVLVTVCRQSHQLQRAC